MTPRRAGLAAITLGLIAAALLHGRMGIPPVSIANAMGALYFIAKDNLVELRPVFLRLLAELGIPDAEAHRG